MNKKFLLTVCWLIFGVSLLADGINYYTLRKLSGFTFIKIDSIEKVWKADDLSSERIYVLRSSGKFLVFDLPLDPLITPGLTQVAIFAKKNVTDPNVQMMIIQRRIMPPYAEIALVIENQIFKSFWQGDLFRPVPVRPVKPVRRR